MSVCIRKNTGLFPTLPLQTETFTTTRNGGRQWLRGRETVFGTGSRKVPGSNMGSPMKGYCRRVLGQDSEPLVAPGE